MNVRYKEQLRPSVADARGETPGENARTRRSLSSVILHDARLLLIALWLGGAVFFSFIVAPSAFAVLPTGALAGALVNRTLAALNLSGFIIGLILLASAFVTTANVSRRAHTVESIMLGIVALATAVGQWVIAARMETLRRAMAATGRAIETIAHDDPLRAAFDTLHKVSVTTLLTGMLAATVALLLIARRVRKL